MPTIEHQRLLDSKARKADWKHWGPYVSERAWGTVREDYSAHGTAWEHFPHDHAHCRAYRWNEDGLGGFCNRFQNICLGLALWNEQDPILKERLFGLTGNEGNHGEDVKEYYFYLDSTPTHSYAKMLYKYPQVAFPYQDLRHVNAQRNRHEPEYELIDALHEAFTENRYFDVFIEYAKAGQEDILCRITAVNRGPEAAPVHLLPQVWFRNSWSWGYAREKSTLKDVSTKSRPAVHAWDRHLGDRYWYVEADAPVELLFTENDTNVARLYGGQNPTPYVKDAFHEAVVHGHTDRTNPAGTGTKAAAHVQAVVAPGEALTIKVRFSNAKQRAPFKHFDQTFQTRIAEADAFYAHIHEDGLSEDARSIQRQAFAGLLWSKQFYHYSIDLWLKGDPAGPPPPHARTDGRNADWSHLYNLDVVSMPDKWEYPWYAAWDLAFHMLPVAMVDPEWAKRQMVLMMREWYMHPNGQMPAYEWAFGDVNPPVHAWAVWRVYKIARNATGKADLVFLERAFHKLLLNFNWWVNRKDVDGHNVFEGGFLGLDNIGVFDRSAELPTGGHLHQADGTAWMAMFSLNMLAIALELAREKPAYEDVATKFFEHFVYIADAINTAFGEDGLWDEAEGFYFDMIHTPDDQHVPLKIFSFVGLIPLYAVETLDGELLDKLPSFKRRMNWFIKYRPHLLKNISLMTEPGAHGKLLLSLVRKEQLERILARMLDPGQFLSDYGLRALSKLHEAQPYQLHVAGDVKEVRYEPAESTTGLFGGNSNWRGPIWFPVNYLMIESLQKFHYYYGDDLQVEHPVGSGQMHHLGDVAADLSARLARLFLKGDQGRRAFYGGVAYFQNDPHWKDYMLFYEYFHGDNGAGIGASHQTGWTALVARLLR